MSRESGDERGEMGRLINGYDYKLKTWVLDGKYVRCGHPDNMGCACYGRRHEGEQTVDRWGRKPDPLLPR